MTEIPFYVTHYTPLYERKVFMEKQFLNLNIVGNFIIKYDQKDIDDKMFLKFDRKKLSIAEISLFLKHLHILQNMVDQSIPFVHIMEDDVKMIECYYEKLVKYTQQLPENADCLFTGSGWKQCQHVPDSLVRENPNTNVFLRTNNGIGRNSPLHKIGWGIGSGSTRTCAEYFIKLKCAKTILNFFNKQNVITTPYDLWLNRVFFSSKSNVYWAHPVLGNQDTFPSSVQL
jgi:GR25 family glycosyltransferase involved in LPS biosynthesis